jgi:hypothetical protein
VVAAVALLVLLAAIVFSKRSGGGISVDEPAEVPAGS